MTPGTIWTIARAVMKGVPHLSINRMLEMILFIYFSIFRQLLLEFSVFNNSLLVTYGPFSLFWKLPLTRSLHSTVRDNYFFTLFGVIEKVRRTDAENFPGNKR